MNNDLDADLLDRLYAVAMEPERFKELASTWLERLEAAGDTESTPALELRHFENHIRRAEELLRLTATNSELLPLPLKEKLEGDPHAIVAVDAQRSVQGMNAAAIGLYGELTGGPVSALPFDDETHRLLAEAVRGLRDAPGETPPRLIRAWHSNAEEPLVLSASRWATASGRNLLLIKAVSFAWPEKLSPMFQRAFELTDAEMAITQLLTEGLSADAIADRRGASVATIRSQVRSVYSKLSVQNRGEFMRLALGLTTLGLAEKSVLTGAFHIPSTEVQPPYPRPEDRRMFRLPDSRHIDYAEFGAPGGIPCLFFHSEFFGDGMTAASVEIATDLGLRIIAPARPYYGRSSPYPDGVVPVDQTAADLPHLLDALGIDKAVVLAQVMCPSIHAANFMWAHPERILGGVFVAPFAPFKSRFGQKSLLSFHRLLSDIAHRNARALEFLAQAGMAYHNRVGSRAFYRLFTEGNRADQTVIDDEIAYAAMANGAQIAGTYGHRGYFHDFRDMPRNLEDRLLSVGAPVMVVVGDTIPEAALRATRGVIAEKANFTEIPARAGGQYAFYSHPDVVWTAVKSAAQRVGRT